VARDITPEIVTSVDEMVARTLAAMDRPSEAELFGELYSTEVQ